MMHQEADILSIRLIKQQEPINTYKYRLTAKWVIILREEEDYESGESPKSLIADFSDLA